MTHLLLVDDEPQLLLTLVLNLTKRGFEVTTAADGATALQLVAEIRPDLVLLDLGLPDIDGLEIIRRIHQVSPALPIIVLSARSGSHEKVVALDLGAFDYVTKPFDMSELVARIRTTARRSGPQVRANAITFGDITVDFSARSVKRLVAGEQRHVRLTPTEWRVLEILLTNPDVLVSSHDILTQLRGGSEHTEASYLRGYIAQLRSKLEAEPGRPRHLLTDPGLGYRFRP